MAPLAPIPLGRQVVHEGHVARIIGVGTVHADGRPLPWALVDYGDHLAKLTGNELYALDDDPEAVDAALGHP